MVVANNESTWVFSAYQPLQLFGIHISFTWTTAAVKRSPRKSFEISSKRQLTTDRPIASEENTASPPNEHRRRTERSELTRWDDTEELLDQQAAVKAMRPGAPRTDGHRHKSIDSALYLPPRAPTDDGLSAGQLARSRSSPRAHHANQYAYVLRDYNRRLGKPRSAFAATVSAHPARRPWLIRDPYRR